MRRTIAICRSARLWLWLSALFVFVFTAHAGSVAQAPVYRILGAQQPAYLIGTMHSEDPRVIALMNQLGPLVDRVDIVAIELVPDGMTMLAVAAATLLPTDRRLRDLLGERRFAALLEAARGQGLPVGVLDRMKPWAAAVALAVPPAETGQFLDMQIYLRALQSGRGVVGLETAAQQLAVFDDMQMPLQRVFLDEMVEAAPRFAEQLEELTLAYLRGDPEQIGRVARGQYADMPTALSDWFEQRMLGERNAGMLEGIAALLGSGDSVLVAVGAMHLGGDSGLIGGLRRLGYRVERWQPATPGG